MKIFFIVAICLFVFVGCKKDKSAVIVDKSKITSDKWTKVSDEVISNIYDVKISDDNSILLLSRDYFVNLNKNFQTVFKYTDFGNAKVSNNEFMKNLSFFTFNVYLNGNNKYSLNYYLMIDNNIAQRTSISGSELYGGDKRILRINGMVSSNEYSGYVAYSSIQTDIFDTIYVYSHFKDAQNIKSYKILSVPSTPLENFQFINNSYFIFYGQYSKDYIHVDMNNHNISHPPYQPKQIIKVGSKLIMIDKSENLFSSDNGKNYQLEIGRSDLLLNTGKLFKSTCKLPQKEYVLKIEINH